MAGPSAADFKVLIVDENDAPRFTVAVIGNHVVDLSAATDGQVITVQPDGSLAAEDPFDLDAMRFKGTIDASTNPNYPAADAGDVWRISVAGKIGGGAGTNVEVGDLIFAIADNAGGTQAAVGASWSIEQANIDGAVVGPAVAVGDNFTTFNGTSGKLVKDSGLSFDVDAALAANSDLRIPSQKAVKAYADLMVPRSLYDASTILIADVDNTPTALVVGASSFVGRKASGGIAAMTAAEAKTVLAIAESDVTNLTTDLGLKAPLASPTFTGTPAAPTAAQGTNTTQLATTAMVRSEVVLLAPLASPALTGNPTAPTQTAGNNSTRLATTAYADALVADAINDGTVGIAPSQNAVFDALALKAPLASPTFTGTLTAGTTNVGTFSTTGTTVTGSNVGGLAIIASGGALDFRAPAANPQILWYTNVGAGNVERMRINSAGDLAIADTTDLVFSTTGAGSKIGTAVSELFAFHGATPVVQRSGAAQAAVAVTGATNVAPFGFSTAAQADAIVTLVNELRAAAVQKGLIKGSA